jgi:hypothetical protein
VGGWCVLFFFFLGGGGGGLGEEKCIIFLEPINIFLQFRCVFQYSISISNSNISNHSSVLQCFYHWASCVKSQKIVLVFESTKNTPKRIKMGKRFLNYLPQFVLQLCSIFHESRGEWDNFRHDFLIQHHAAAKRIIQKFSI